MKATLLAAIAVPLVLAGCATGGHCVDGHEYQEAASLPDAPSVPGLTVPESPSALHIPPPAANPAPFAERVPDPEDPGDTVVHCLDVPRPLVEKPSQEAPKT